MKNSKKAKVKKCNFGINVSEEARLIADELGKKLDRPRSWIFEAALKEYSNKMNFGKVTFTFDGIEEKTKERVSILEHVALNK